MKHLLGLLLTFPAMSGFALSEGQDGVEVRDDQGNLVAVVVDRPLMPDVNELVLAFRAFECPPTWLNFSDLAPTLLWPAARTNPLKSPGLIPPAGVPQWLRRRFTLYGSQLKDHGCIP